MLKNKIKVLKLICCLALSNFAVFRLYFIKQKHELHKFGLIVSLKNANSDYTCFGLNGNLLFIRQSFDKDEILVRKNYPVKHQHNDFNDFFVIVKYNNGSLPLNLYHDETVA